MAEVDGKLSTEIAEWQGRMERFLVDQQQEQAPVGENQSAQPIAQNGTSSGTHDNDLHPDEPEEPRAPSQLRE